MSYERQLSKLHLRGSLVNVTMKEMAPEEKQLVELTFSNLIDDPRLNKSKIKFIKRFNRTIRADYKDDIDNSLQDYNIALWRALVDLLIHHKVEGFHCSHCGSKEYTNHYGQTIKFNQKYLISPCCNLTSVDGILKNQETLTEEDLAKSRSIIIATRGQKKYNNEAILNDRNGLIKFVSKHISNYQQMVIKENQMAKAEVEKNSTTPAAAYITEKIHAILKTSNYQCRINYMNNVTNELLPVGTDIRDVNSLPLSNQYHLIFDTFGCDTDVIIRIMLILQDGITSGIIHELLDDRLIISGSIYEKISVIKTVKEKIKFTNTTGGKQFDLDSDGLDNLGHGGNKMIGFGDDHEKHVETNEIIQKIYNSLNATSKIIYTLQVQSNGLIIAGQPDLYQSYSDQFPGSKLNNTDLARYLGVNTRTVKKCKEEIKTQCFFHGLEAV